MPTCCFRSHALCSSSRTSWLVCSYWCTLISAIIITLVYPNTILHITSCSVCAAIGQARSLKVAGLLRSNCSLVQSASTQGKIGCCDRSLYPRPAAIVKSKSFRSSTRHTTQQRKRWDHLIVMQHTKQLCKNETVYSQVYMMYHGSGSMQEQHARIHECTHGCNRSSVDVFCRNCSGKLHFNLECDAWKAWDSMCQWV